MDKTSIGMIDALFRRHTRLHHLYLRDLRDGREWEIGMRRRYPIGSCFKLALVMAVFDALDVEEMDRPVTIAPEQHVNAVGVIKLIDSAISLTPHQLCQLVLTASDATATDILIARVGLDAVDRVLRRHAPDSHLACNLADMVEAFRAMPESATCKQRDWTKEALGDYVDRVANLGATHTRDLAELALATWGCRAPNNLTEQWRRIVRNFARSHPRTEAFYGHPVQALTKTGSLGYRFFVNECGLIFHQNAAEPVAIFGWCAAGSQLPSFVMETIGGEVGLFMLDTLGIERPFSPDWTAAGSAMVHGLER